MFAHCALSWCQCFHIVSWVGVNVSTLCAELVSMFPHCALSWCQCFHIVHWVGVNVFTLCTELVSMFSHCELGWCLCFHIALWVINNSSIWKRFQRGLKEAAFRKCLKWYINAWKPTQDTAWKHWHQFNAQSGYIDINSATFVLFLVGRVFIT